MNLLVSIEVFKKPIPINLWRSRANRWRWVLIIRAASRLQKVKSSIHWIRRCWVLLRRSRQVLKVLRTDGQENRMMFINNLINQWVRKNPIIKINHLINIVTLLVLSYKRWNSLLKRVHKLQRRSINVMSRQLRINARPTTILWRWDQYLNYLLQHIKSLEKMDEIREMLKLD